MKYRIETLDDGASVGFTWFPTNFGKNYQITLISRDNDNDVSARLNSLVENVPKYKADMMLKAINECNVKCSFVKFILDDNGNVSLKNDISPDSDDDLVGIQVVATCAGMISIVEKTYPILLKALWD